MRGYCHLRTGFAAGLLFMLALVAVAEPASIIRVKPGGTDSNPGSDWTLAKATVTAALTAAVSGDEVWVSSGTYAERITLKSGVALYGGFAGTETVRGQRDWLANVTTLNGSSGGTVVTVSGAVASTRLDGFTVTGGNAGSGGGISVTAGSSPTISNNIIKLNQAGTYGGGIFCSDSSPVISANSILWNLSGNDGGGISCWRNSSPTIANNRIIGNTSNLVDGASFSSVGGGGVFTTAADLDGRPHPTAVANPVIVNNIVAANGGDNGAGIRVNDLNGGTATITNNTIVANSGVGLYWQKEYSNTTVIATNNIVAFNTWGMQQRGATSFQIRHNNVFGNSLYAERADYMALDDQTGLNGNISVDPKLAAYTFGNLHVQPDSPCRDAGLSSAVGGGWTDIDGQARIIGNAVDIGADESDGTLWNAQATVIHVKPDGDDGNDGLTWDSAKKTLTGALFAAPSAGWEVWAAKGAYTEHIALSPFVHLYGGFNGDETARESRNIAANPTIIDGAGIKKVVRSLNTGYLVSTLDGFTVQNGGLYTFDGGDEFDKLGVGGVGGGIYIEVSSPVIANNLIRWNSLHQDNTPIFPQPPSYGAGMYARMSHAVISGNTIRENEILNTFDGSGGGIYCDRSGLMIRNNVFRENHALQGSAIYCIYAYPYIRDNLIENNAMYNTYPLPLYMGSQTGAVSLVSGPVFIIQANTIRGNTAASGAGIYASTNRDGRILNNLITGNRAVSANTSLGGEGGGIYCLAPLDATGSHLIVNNTIVGNRADGFMSDDGGGIALSIPPPIYTPPDPIPDRVIIANNIIAFNSTSVWQHLLTPMVPPVQRTNDRYSNANDNPANSMYVPPGATDILSNPDFVDRAGGDYHLNASSQCIDKGSNSVVPLYTTTDIGGQPRFMDGDLNGSYVVDIGAYEFAGPADTAPPTGSIQINGGSAYTNSPAVTLGLTATDDLPPVQMCLSNVTAPSCPGTWEDFNATRAWSLLSGDGPKTVYAWFRDRVGNVSAPPYSATIILDTVAPTGSIFILNSNAVYTNTTGVYLTLTASDGNQSSLQMCASATPSCSTWEAFVSRKDWELPPGDGLKTVYVRYRDGAGNVSDQYSDTITLDQSLPSDGTATATPGDARVSLAWSGFTDGLSGISNYKILFKTTGAPAHCNDGSYVLPLSSPYVHTPLMNGTVYYYLVCAVDNAGNLSLGVPVSATPHKDVILLVSGAPPPPGDFDSIQAACEAVNEQGDIIKARAVNLSGDVIFNRPYGVVLKGGYDAAYTSNPSFTTIHSLTVVDGAVTVEGIAVR